MLKTEIATIKPGGIQNQGIPLKTLMDWALFNISPQLGVGGRTPRPRKLKLASAKIADATPKLAETITGATTFGNKCLSIITLAGTPMLRAAVTYSISLADKTWARTRRVILGQRLRLMDKMIFGKFGSVMVTKINVNKRLGNAITASEIRINNESTQPP